MAERKQCRKDVLRIAIPHGLKAPTESLSAGAAQVHDSCLVEIKLVLQPECARLYAALHLRVYAWVCAKQGRWEKIAWAQLLLKERSFHRAKASLMMGSCQLQSWLLSAAASDIK